MIGYETLIRVSAAPSFGSQATLGQRGIYINADSVTFDFGAVAAERDNKLTGGRESNGSTYSVDRYMPTAEVTWQPRPDDMLPFVLAHFQNATTKANGTYEFWRAAKNLKWVTNGSNWGTNPYTIQLDVFYGNSLHGGGTGGNGFRGFNGVVDQLTITGKYGEDVKAVAKIKFLTASRFTFPSGFNTVPNACGSFSEFAVLVDSDVTFNMDSGEVSNGYIDVDAFEGNFSNFMEGRSRLGQSGYTRFPLAKHWKAEGKIDAEFNRDLNIIAEGTSHNGTFGVTSGVGFQVFYHNFVFRNTPIDVNDGEQVVDMSLGFRAYPTVTSGTSSLFKVITGSTYGTALFNFTGTIFQDPS